MDQETVLSWIGAALAGGAALGAAIGAFKQARGKRRHHDNDTDPSGPAHSSPRLSQDVTIAVLNERVRQLEEDLKEAVAHLRSEIIRERGQRHALKRELDAVVREMYRHRSGVREAE